MAVPPGTGKHSLAKDGVQVEALAWQERSGAFRLNLRMTHYGMMKMSSNPYKHAD